jgi:rhodanese-related sulfurtransferase
VLDVRAADEFAAGHLAGSGHVPVADFATRRTELPPREAAVLVVAHDVRQAEAGAQALSALGFTDVHWLDAPLAALEGGLSSREPAVRLWRPAPFLQEVLPLLPRGRAADLAAGAGREAVFLAMHGFEVEAFDSDPDALADAAALAARHGVRLVTVSTDLEARDPALPANRYETDRLLSLPPSPTLPRDRARACAGWASRL